MERPPGTQTSGLNTFCAHLGRLGAEKAPLRGVYTACRMLPCTQGSASSSPRPKDTRLYQGEKWVVVEAQTYMEVQGFASFSAFAGEAGERR